MPEKVVTVKKPPKSHSWTCPDCGQVIKHTFDGVEHVIDRGLGNISRCGGLFESVIVKCGACGCDIKITREEIEKEVT